MKRKTIAALLAGLMAVSAPVSAFAGEEDTVPETQAAEVTEAGTEAEESTEADMENTAPAEQEPDVDVAKYLTITDEKYKEIAVTVSPKQEVLDEDVDDEIRSEASDAGLGKQITDGKVKDGDTVNIDYVGKKDGEAFDGGTASGVDLEIGSGTYIDGFESGLVGVKIGDTVDLDLTFPEDYGAEDLAGQDVVFTVTVNYVQGEPELNDDLADKLTDGETRTIDELRKSVREDLEAQNEEDYNRELYSEIFSQLVEIYPISEYPQDFIDYYVSNNMSQLQQQAEAESESLDDMLKQAYGTDSDQMKDYFTTYAEQLLQQRIILGAIAKKENITLSDEDFQKIIKDYADQYGITVDDLLSYYNEKDIRESELENKVMEYLKGVVSITEEEETEYDDVEELTIETESGTEAETEGESENTAAGTGETEN